MLFMRANPSWFMRSTLKRSDHIEAAYFETKISDAKQGPLKVICMGWPDMMKGALYPVQSQNRDRLVDLVQQALQDGTPFDDNGVFKHRSDVIRKYL